VIGAGRVAEECSGAQRSGGVAVFMAALLLFVVAIPIVSAKLDSLSSSEFTFLANTYEPACVPPGFCFRFLDAKVRRTESDYRIAVRIEGVDDLYDLARELDEGELKVIPASGSEDAELPTIRPHYDLYINVDEAARQVPASLQFNHVPPARITLAFERSGAVSEYRTLDITRGEIGTLASLIVGTGQPGPVRVGIPWVRPKRVCRHDWHPLGRTRRSRGDRIDHHLAGGCDRRPPAMARNSDAFSQAKAIRPHARRAERNDG